MISILSRVQNVNLRVLGPPGLDPSTAFPRTEPGEYFEHRVPRTLFAKFISPICFAFVAMRCPVAITETVAFTPFEVQPL